MIDKKHIEKYICLNGLSADSPESEIRTLLMESRWHEEDVDAAMELLRNGSNENVEKAHSLQRMTNTDDKLKPETLTSLLGMKVEVEELVESQAQIHELKYRKQLISIAVISVIGAALIMFGVMWHMKVGVFHEFALQF